jgi:hypothetical protein
MSSIPHCKIKTKQNKQENKWRYHFSFEEHSYAFLPYPLLFNFLFLFMQFFWDPTLNFYDACLIYFLKSAFVFDCYFHCFSVFSIYNTRKTLHFIYHLLSVYLSSSSVYHLFIIIYLSSMYLSCIYLSSPILTFEFAFHEIFTPPFLLLAILLIHLLFF